MSERRRAVKAVWGAGVLVALVAATGGVVASGLTEQDRAAVADPALDATSADATSSDTTSSDPALPATAALTVSADIPLVNLDLEAADIVTVGPASRSAAREALTDGEGVTFTVVVGGASTELTTTTETLADALAEADIVLGWDDQVSADLSAPPQAGAEVHIGQATTQYVTEQIVTPHATEQRESSTLLKGNTRVVQRGVDGDARVTSEVLLVDGVEESRTTIVSTQLTASVTEIVEIGTRVPPVVVAPAPSGGGSSGGSASTTAQYTLRQFMSAGVVNWDGYRFTYYSQSVLPGGGLSIPGRHVNADGYVSDGDGYIVLANDSPKGTVINTPFGYQGKVYDRGTSGNHYDVYIR